MKRRQGWGDALAQIRKVKDIDTTRFVSNAQDGKKWYGRVAEVRRFGEEWVEIHNAAVCLCIPDRNREGLSFSA